MTDSSGKLTEYHCFWWCWWGCSARSAI